MKKNNDKICSFVITFCLTIAAFFYFDYLQTKKQEAIVKVYSVLEAFSGAGIEIGYKDLNVVRNPSYIDFKASDIEVLGVEDNFFANNAKLKINSSVGFALSFSDVNINHKAKIKNIEISGLNKDINLVAHDIEFKGVNFEVMDLLLTKDGEFFEVKQLVLKNKDVSIVAQGECEFAYSDDYDCKLNTSSQGLLEFLQLAKEKDMFTSRGVYVADLVLRSQTSKRVIAPVEIKPDGFYIKNILMTHEKSS
ncbi:MAG: hypothetical protein R3Y43_00375 [Alphaproteobacteria bacterium]